MRQRWVPHEYQLKAIRFIIQHACAGLFLDPGLGKTSIMLQAFKLMKLKGYARKMLVVAPLRPAQSTWPNEVAKWEEFKDLKISVLHGADKRWDEVFKADINVINPEGLPWLFSGITGDWPWDILCVDESTRFKHTKTQRFRVLKPKLEKFARRYILTGTPAPNGLLDLFGQVFILDLGHALGPFITAYRETYFKPTGFGGYTWVPKEDTPSKIYKKLAPLVLRMEAADYLKLPPLIFNKVEVELPEEAMRVYREMEAFLISEIKGNKVIADNAAAASIKCRQIANGGIYGTATREVDGRHVHDRVALHIHDAKTEATSDIIEELQGTPALVAYEFDHDLTRLREKLGDVPHIGGGVGVRRFREIEAEWNRGNIPILLAQPQSVAHGLNLQDTHAHVIRHSLVWDLEADAQFIQRVWRQGQKEKVTVHSIVAKDTIDEVIMSVLKGKDRTQKALLDALKGKYA